MKKDDTVPAKTLSMRERWLLRQAAYWRSKAVNKAVPGALPFATAVYTLAAECPYPIDENDIAELSQQARQARRVQ